MTAMIHVPLCDISPSPFEHEGNTEGLVDVHFGQSATSIRHLGEVSSVHSRDLTYPQQHPL
jgi:hypothetical protein